LTTAVGGRNSLRPRFNQQGFVMQKFRVTSSGILLVCCCLAYHTAAAAASCEAPFSAAFAEVSPSVVRIFTVAIDPFSVTERVRTAIGTGIVFDDRGHIVTNAHLVLDTSEVIVSNETEELWEATVVGLDPITDLAVVRLDPGTVRLPSAKLGKSADLLVADEVMAIGYPYGAGKTATRGIVSAVERILPLSPFSWRSPFIQTDAAINPGNSGGPLLTRCGEVIGINTLTTEVGQSISYAVPIDLVRELVPELIESGHVSRAWHGINGHIVPLPLAFALGVTPGFLVETVEPGSPAERLGLRGGSFPVVIAGQEYLLGGDVIMAVNGETLSDEATVTRIARSLRVGETLEIEYWQDEELKSAQVVLPERPLLPGDVRRFREPRNAR